MSFDADDQSPYDEKTTRAQAEEIAAALPIDARILDLGCGTGRVARHLPGDMRLEGVDRNSDVLKEYARHTNGDTHQLDLVGGGDNLPNGPFDAVIMLGNTLMEIADPVSGFRLFQEISRRLSPEGMFVIDDFPITGWHEVAIGHWRDGIDEAGEMQMVWEDGNPVFTLRRGSAVDPDNWVIAQEERRYRLWSLGNCA